MTSRTSPTGEWAIDAGTIIHAHIDDADTTTVTFDDPGTHGIGTLRLTTHALRVLAVELERALFARQLEDGFVAGGQVSA